MIRRLLAHLLGPESVYPEAALASVTAAMAEEMKRERAT